MNLVPAALTALENEIAKLPQVIFPVRHYFAQGLYAREMTIPAGGILTGAIHKTEHLAVISQGTIRIFDGDQTKTLSAPLTFISQPGVKRAGFALTETVFTTFHATEERDLDKLVEELCESTAEELVGGKNNKQLLQNKQDYPYLQKQEAA
jgi:hypothetical protein